MFSIPNILMLGATMALVAVLAASAPSSQPTGMTVEATVIAS